MAASHSFAFLYVLALAWPGGGIARIALTALLATCAFAAWLALNIYPVRAKEPVNVRLKAMMGGRGLIRAALLSLFWQGVLYAAVVSVNAWAPLPVWVRVTDGVIAAIVALLPLTNGALRVFCLSRRLRVVRRLVVLATWWIPLLGAIPLMYLARIAKDEYEHACYKIERRGERVDTLVCRTKYPLVMLHGVGFRDLHYFNYWGRIPKELQRNGASVYYGHQEAWGSVERNAQDVKRRIERVLEETGAPKVNIIAHSKGGLDARYMISSLGGDEIVASLTTISTPHRGCAMVDAAQKLPQKLYASIGRAVDKYFGMLGDEHPEFDVSSRQFTKAYVERFNQNNPDAWGVYYQSYASAMRAFLSDGLLAVPYTLMYFLKGPNDGLVDVESAKWGEFKGLLRGGRFRGVSHGDMIDLKREDYKGFDVAEAYVGIVSGLREMGF